MFHCVVLCNGVTLPNTNIIMNKNRKSFISFPLRSDQLWHPPVLLFKLLVYDAGHTLLTKAMGQEGMELCFIPACHHDVTIWLLKLRNSLSLTRPVSTHM
jgi:hypothetical protein